jgi:chromosome condensin MukBEF ATPase and DNA-binding subunit MukB
VGHTFSYKDHEYYEKIESKTTSKFPIEQYSSSLNDIVQQMLHYEPALSISSEVLQRTTFFEDHKSKLPESFFPNPSDEIQHLKIHFKQMENELSNLKKENEQLKFDLSYCKKEISISKEEG